MDFPACVERPKEANTRAIFSQCRVYEQNFDVRIALPLRWRERRRGNLNAWKNVRCQMVAVPGFWLGSRFLFDVMTARFFTSRPRVLTSPWRGGGGVACSVPCRAGPCLLHEPPPVFPGDTTQNTAVSRCMSTCTTYLVRHARDIWLGLLFP